MYRKLSMWIVLFSLLALGCRAVTVPLGLAEPYTGFEPAPATQPWLPLSPSPTALMSQDYQMRLHPDGPLYVGDWLSIEVIASESGLLSGRQTVEVGLAGEPERILGRQDLRPYGIGGRMQATFLWALDSSVLAPGAYTLTLRTEADGLIWLAPFQLLPASEQPAAQRQAAWQVARSACCAVNYVSGTEGERDLDILLAEMDRQAAAAQARMLTQQTEPITITLLPRVLGHGGFAGSEISVSYLDRNYAANDPAMLIHHEIVHILDRRLGGQYMSSMLVEGLAVYLSEGHFKPEPVLARAAALLEDVPALPAGGLGWYIPLETLAGDFYAAQHEIGYLQAAALVAYLVERWGWEEFSSFYRQIERPPDLSGPEALDRALRLQWGLSLAELEADFIAFLRQQPTTPAWREDVRLTVEFYDTLRRYQQQADPSAYFRSAWLLDANEMRRRGITADYSRRPEAELNLVVELLLTSAGADLQAGRSQAVDEQLRAVNQMFDALQNGRDPFCAHSLAFDVWLLLQHTYWLQELAGPQADDLYPVYEPQRLRLGEQNATLWLRAPDGGLVEQHYLRLPGGWLALDGRQ